MVNSAPLPIFDAVPTFLFPSTEKAITPSLPAPVVPGSRYLIKSDEEERCRLEVQHVILREVIYGDRLIYDSAFRIPSKGGEILDAGTGSGAWIMDLAYHVSESVHLHGVDVSGKLFPRVYPANVSFSLGSVTQMSCEWTSRFHFVNQRLLMAGLRADEWPTAVAEFHRVIQPGGAIQLLELHNKLIPGTSQTVVRAKTLFEKLYTVNGLSFDCADKLAGWLEAAGFVSIKTDVRLYPVGKGGGRIGEMGRDAMIGSWRGMRTAIMKARENGIDVSEEEFDELMEKLELEWDEGDAKMFSFQLVTARKPF